MSPDITHTYNTEPHLLKPSLENSTQGKLETVALESLDEFESEDDSNTQSQSNASPIATLFKLLPLGISCWTLFYLFHLGGEVASIRNNYKQVLVQTVDGRSILAQPVDNLVRTPVTVEQTVKLWIDLSLNWVQKLPDGKQDPGVKIATKIFPTRLVYGSTLLSQESQQIWYDVFKQRDDYLPSNFFTSNATRIFYPKLQTSPKPPLDDRTGQPIENRYEVEIYGDWIEYSPENTQGKLIDRLALKLRLRPVVKTEPPLSEDADSLQQAAYQLRANGLEIYNIQRIQRSSYVR